MTAFIILLAIYLIISNKERIIVFVKKLSSLRMEDIKKIKKENIFAWIKMIPAAVVEAIGDFLMVLERNTIGKVFPGKNAHRKAFSPLFLAGMLFVVEVMVLGGKYFEISKAEKVLDGEWRKVNAALQNSCLANKVGESKEKRVIKDTSYFYPSKTTESKYKVCRDKNIQVGDNNLDVMAASARYNSSVQQYNKTKEGFLGEFVSNMFGYDPGISFLRGDAGVSAPLPPVVSSKKENG